VLLSVVIPCHNEAGNIGRTLDAVAERLVEEGIDFEIVAVDDHCSDGTVAEIHARQTREPRIRCVANTGPGGFGHAVRCGLNHFRGDAVAIVMADLSDAPEDLVAYHRILESGSECAFGSRFVKGSQVIDYPSHKLVLNRLANTFIRLLFGLRYNDVTNAFKAYRAEVIRGCTPLLSAHFNLTVEIPLKAIIRGYSYQVVPISWRNRATGVSKLRIREMGSRYLFIVLYVLLERWLTGRDYSRRDPQP
jgi:dolichol-phosphate mannosyltransferase